MPPETAESEQDETVNKKMLERTNGTRETDEIQSEATKLLKAEHNDF